MTAREVKVCLHENRSLCSATTYADNVALPAFARRAAVRRAAIGRLSPQQPWADARRMQYQ